MKKIVLIIGVLILFLTSCTQHKDTGRLWWETLSGPAYQVLVYSFADSDGDGFGDLKGLISKLDYLNDGRPETDTDLGISMLWLSPIHPASSYHGYDVIDFTSVSSRLGTMEDFELLVKGCKARGIHVLLDIPFNHTSPEHSWFKAMIENPGSKYGSYYQRKKEGITYGSGGMGSFYKTKAKDGTTIEYFGAFWSGMPDLNCGNPDVLKEFNTILSFWLKKGVSGFRFDAAKHIFDLNEMPAGTPVLQMNRDFWQALKKSIPKKYGDVFFIGEVLSEQMTEVAAYAPAFDSLFDFADASAMLSASGGGAAHTAFAKIVRNISQLTKIENFTPSHLLTNHDQDRSMSILLGKEGLSLTDGIQTGKKDTSNSEELKSIVFTKAKLAASLYQTLPGIPFIYYGEEIGLTGIRYENDDISRRDALIWDIDSPWNTSWQPSAKMPAGQNALTNSILVQDKDETSLLNHYRGLAALRKNSAAVREGSFSRVDWAGFNTSELMSYFRSTRTEDKDGETVLVIHNTGMRNLEVPVPQGSTLYLLWSSTEGLLKNREIYTIVHISPGESLVFELR
jgi:glycosidase